MIHVDVYIDFWHNPPRSLVMEFPPRVGEKFNIVETNAEYVVKEVVHKVMISSPYDHYKFEYVGYDVLIESMKSRS